MNTPRRPHPSLRGVFLRWTATTLLGMLSAGTTYALLVIGGR